MNKLRFLALNTVFVASIVQPAQAGFFKYAAGAAALGVGSVVVMANKQKIKDFTGDTLAIVPWNRYTLAAYYKNLTPEQKQIYIDKLEEYNQELIERALEMKNPALAEQYKSYKEKFESLKGNYENFSEVANDLIMIKKSWQGIFDSAYRLADHLDKNIDYETQHAWNNAVDDPGYVAAAKKDALSQYKSAADTLFYSAKAVVDAAKAANVGGRVAGQLAGDKLIDSLASYADDMKPKTAEESQSKNRPGDKSLEQLEKEYNDYQFHKQENNPNEIIRSGNLN